MVHFGTRFRPDVPTFSGQNHPGFNSFYFKVSIVLLFVYTDEDSLDSFKDCYYKEAKDEEDFDWDYIHGMYDLSKMQGHENCIDYKKFADELFMEDFHFDNGFVFRSS